MQPGKSVRGVDFELSEEESAESNNDSDGVEEVSAENNHETEDNPTRSQQNSLCDDCEESDLGTAKYTGITVINPLQLEIGDRVVVNLTFEIGKNKGKKNYYLGQLTSRSPKLQATFLRVIP